MIKSTSLLEAVLARDSASGDGKKDSATLDLLLRWRMSAWLERCAQNGCSGKTCRGSCRAGRISDASSPPLMGSGILSHGLFSTASFGEYRNDGDACFLSDVLEPIGSVPQRYFLSRRACAGILRRAEKKGKKIPAQLKEALTSVASGGG